MDTTAPLLDKDGKPVQNAVVDPMSQAQPSAPPPVAPALGKEYEPGQSLSEYAELPGHELDPRLSPELEKAGVETVQNPEHPQLTVEDKRAGIAPGIDALRHPTQVAGTTLPATKSEATVVVENKQIKIWDAIKWRMKNILRQYAKEEVKP